MPRRPPRSTALAIALAKRLLAKYRAHYRARHDTELPVLLVAGTAGKSSTTLLLKNLFERDGWRVYSGARPAQCLNSVTGLSMVLGEFESDFEGKMALFHKLWFLLRGWVVYLSKRLDLPQKSILIYEVGFNEQGESEYFREVFAPSVAGVVLTNLTSEHAFGFAEEFDRVEYARYRETIPAYWQQALEDETLSGRLRNIALEQFKLLALTSRYAVPLVIGTIDNGVLTNFNEELHTPKRYTPKVSRTQDFILESDGLAMGRELLLPRTFAKNAFILDTVALHFQISKGVVASTLTHLEVPNGRFSLLRGVTGSQIVDSTYNSDPASLEGFLILFEEVVSEFALRQKKRTLPAPYGAAPKHTLILGEMRELGSEARGAHARILERVVALSEAYAEYIEDIFLVGQEWLELDDEVKKQAEATRYLRFRKQLFKVFLRAGDINRLLDLEQVRAGSWFWLKGSQNTVFLELVVAHLLADTKDEGRLCRRGQTWDEHRAAYK